MLILTPPCDTLHHADQRATFQRRTSVFCRLSFAIRMTITRASFARSKSQPPKFARSATPSYVRTAGRGPRRRWLRNVRGDRGVAGMTRGTASGGAGSGAGSEADLMKVKIDGSRRRGGGMSTTRGSTAMARVLRGEAKRAHLSAADIARARLRMTRRGRNDDGGGIGDMLRDRGAPMEVTSGVLVARATLPPSDIAHVLLMTKNITHGDIVIVGGALGVQVQTVLMMGIPAHGTNDAPIATAAHADTGIDHAHFRAHPIRRLAPRHYRMGWVLTPGIDRLIRGPQVSPHRRRTAPVISLNASLNYAANSKGREESHRLKLHPAARAHVHAHPHRPLHPFPAIPPPPNRRALLLQARVHHLVHHRPSHHQPTFCPIAFDRTCRRRWTSTSKRPTTLA